MIKNAKVCVALCATFLISQFIAFYYLWAIGFGWLYTGPESEGAVITSICAWLCTAPPVIVIFGD